MKGRQDTEADTLNPSFGNNQIYKSGQYNVTVTHLDTLATRAGTVKDCKQFYFDAPDMMDEEHGYTIAPGIGFVEKYAGWGITYKLLSFALADK